MSVRQRLEEIKREILEKFVAELMSELSNQGFTFADVLEALAACSSEPLPDEIVKKLEELARAIREVG